jgi:hypothetical protein
VSKSIVEEPQLQALPAAVEQREGVLGSGSNPPA